MTATEKNNISNAADGVDHGCRNGLAPSSASAGGLVHIQLLPESHAILSELLLAAASKLSGEQRDRIKRLAGACKVDTDRILDLH
jgi:hypothetical protein